MTSKAAKGPPKLEEFLGIETILDGETVISAQEDADGRMMATIRIIKAGVSKNNRNYRPSALKKAAQEGIFNGVRMFVDHTTPGKAPTSRKFYDLVSAIESTEYDEENKALNGRVEFFDEAFYKRVDRAKKYTGVSIDSVLRGTRHPQPGGRALEDIHEFAQPRSVDWVVYPAAGGEILAMESEGDENVIDWAALEAEAGTLTEEELKKNAPSLWKKFHPETTANGLPVHGNAPESTADDEEFVRKEEIDEIVSARITAYQTEQKAVQERIASAMEQVRAAFATSGLPDRTQKRLMQGFEAQESFDEAAVQKAIDDAKEELKAAGAGPRITGMGASGSQESTGEVKTFSAHENVAALFGKKAATSDDPKEGK